MPTFTPRTAQEAAVQILARMVARTGLTDAAQGSVVSGIAGAVGYEVEAQDSAINALKKAHWLDASGDLLDERIGDMPPGFVPRLGASAATTDAIQLTIADSAGLTVIPAGTVYGRTDRPGVTYVQVADVTAIAHQTSYPGVGDPPVRVVASAVGSSGNCDSGGQITLVLTPVNGLVGVTNTGTVGGGSDRETDDSLKARARAYMASLSGATNGALIYTALTYQSAGGVRIRHATVWEDPTRPGYAELLIDDGTGLGGYTRAGLTTGGTVPTEGLTVIYYEAPCTEPIGTTGTLTINGGAATSGDWVSVQERGVLYPGSTLFVPGDAWAIAGYQVYTGPIAELQGVVEGTLSAWWQSFGKRPSGGRVVVRPPNVQDLPLTAQIRVRAGADPIATRQLIIAEFGAYLADIPPGDPFRTSVLYQRVLDNVPDVTSWLITSPAADKYPIDRRTRFIPPPIDQIHIT